jgi:L-fuculose-phosphate aldolase
MSKIFYTDHDIEDIFNTGTTSLTIDDDKVVLTDLAFEKAGRLGLKLIHQGRQESPVIQVASDTRINFNPNQDIGFENLSTLCQRIDTHRRDLRFSQTASEKELRNAVIETGRLAYQAGLMVSNDGNISALMSDGNILITPSGVCKGRIIPDDLLVIDLDGNIIKPAVDPKLKPTSEQPMHLEVYRQRKDVRAVIHTHLIYANALAITVGKIRMDVIPEAAMAFKKVPITDFAMPSSSQNASAIRSMILENDVLLIRNHGSLTVGKSLDEALNNLERLEHVSKTLVLAQLLGDIHTLPPDILDAIAQVSEQAKAVE